MRDTRSNRRIPFAIFSSIALLLVTGAWAQASAQVMPLPVGPPLARTDGPSYGPAYPPPRLASAEPQAAAPAAPQVETPKANAPAAKPKLEVKRDVKPDRRHVIRDRTDHRATRPMPTPFSFPPEPAPRRQAQHSR